MKTLVGGNTTAVLVSVIKLVFIFQTNKLIIIGYTFSCSKTLLNNIW